MTLIFQKPAYILTHYFALWTILFHAITEHVHWKFCSKVIVKVAALVSHCTKNIQIRSFSWSVFARFWTESQIRGNRPENTPYLDTFCAVIVSHLSLNLKLTALNTLSKFNQALLIKNKTNAAFEQFLFQNHITAF